MIRIIKNLSSYNIRNEIVVYVRKCARSLNECSSSGWFVWNRLRQKESKYRTERKWHVSKIIFWRLFTMWFFRVVAFVVCVIWKRIPKKKNEFLSTPNVSVLWTRQTFKWILFDDISFNHCHFCDSHTRSHVCQWCCADQIQQQQHTGRRSLTTKPI